METVVAAAVQLREECRQQAAPHAPLTSCPGEAVGHDALYHIPQPRHCAIDSVNQISLSEKMTQGTKET